MIRETPSVPSTEDLIALIAALRAENASLKARIAELERRLGLNSSNSGKPPSSDGLKKPARVTSLRERSGKKPGGQKGHKGETLRQVADPDDVVDHYPSACSGCGAGLDPDASVGHSARQVFDLPEPQPLVVTEHRAHDCRCAACGAKTRAPFPDGVNAPVQYGARNRRLRALSPALSVVAREASGRIDGRSPRREAGHRDDRENEPDLPDVSRALPMSCEIMSRRRRSSTWMKPAFASAAKRNGCISPPPRC